jgi:hypothetical protein
MTWGCDADSGAIDAVQKGCEEGTPKDFRTKFEYWPWN